MCARESEGHDEDPVETLAKLNDKSLVQIEPSQDVSCYRLLETVREFAFASSLSAAKTPLREPAARTATTTWRWPSGRA